MNLEIGGGTLTPEGWTNLDCRNGEGDWKRNAQDIPWPAEDDSIQKIHASHVMEHIPAGQERIDVMNEAHRVLAPGGSFTIQVPALVATFENGAVAVCWQAIADPTHISYWCEQSFWYFDGTFGPSADYGIRPWLTVTLQQLPLPITGVAAPTGIALKWIGVPV